MVVKNLFLFFKKTLLIFLLSITIPLFFYSNSYALNGYLPHCNDLKKQNINNFVAMPNHFVQTYPVINYNLLQGRFDKIDCVDLNYCSDLNDEGELIIKTPGYNEDGEAEVNCLRKSCLDLTKDELKAVFEYQYGITAEAYYGLKSDETANDTNFYKFCEPYKYKEADWIIINLTNPIEYLSAKKFIVTITDIENNTQSVDIKFNETPIYCNEFEDAESLKYIISSLRGLKSKANSTEDVYQCIPHQCPLGDDDSFVACDTNFWLFSDKDTKTGERVRSDFYIEEYEKRILNNKYYPGSNYRKNICTPISCDTRKYIQSISCFNDQNGEIYDNQCDIYTGLDRNNTSQSIFQSIKNYNQSEQECINRICKQTIDCGLASNADNKLCILSSEDVVVGEIDDTLSYFYRPAPNSQSIEQLDVVKNEITNNVVYAENFTGGSGNGVEQSVSVVKRNFLGKKATSPLTITEDEYSMVRYQEGDFAPKNYFNYLNDEVKEKDNICFASIDDFKNYGGIQKTRNNETYYEGEYYKFNLGGFWEGGSSFETRNYPYSIPFCSEVSGVSRNNLSNGEDFFCPLNGGYCATPRKDSYYIKGDPTIIRSSTSPDIESVSVNVCLRNAFTMDNGKEKFCGARDCRVKCVNDESCNTMTQTCGTDSCVTLTWRNGEECTPSGLKNFDEIDSSKWESDCAKIVRSEKTILKYDISSGGYPTSKEMDYAVRFRLTKHNNKMYVFVDSTKNKCISDLIERGDNSDEYINSTYIKGKAGFDLGSRTFYGRLTNDSLFDDNGLNDNDGDGKITDEDVYGSYLFSKFSCDNPNNKNEKCEELSMDGFVADNDSSWITWDIVPFIADNQAYKNDKFNIDTGDFESSIMYSSGCSQNGLKNCRGYYDANLNFHKEAQGMSLPISSPPNNFYKYATLSNSPSLFLPILKIVSATNYESIFTILNNEDSLKNIELNFLRPSIDLQFGDVESRNVVVDYKKSELSGKIENISRKTTQNFQLRKTSTISPDIQAYLCLDFVSDKDSDIKKEIQCLKRRNPEIKSIMLRPMPSDLLSELNPYMQIILLDDENKDKDTLSGKIANNTFFSVNGSNKIYYNSYAEAEEYPILVEKSYCSQLTYECPKYKREVIEKERELYTLNLKGNLTNEEKETQSGLIEEVYTLRNNISKCDNQIKDYCDNADGGEISFAFVIQDSFVDFYDIRKCELKTNEAEKNVCLANISNLGFKKDNINYNMKKIKKNYNLVDVRDEICITRGFEDYLDINVVAHKSENGILGKCELTAESKKKDYCRRDLYYEYCTDNNNPACLPIDGDFGNNCSEPGSCVEAKSCDCEDNGVECDSLPDECFLPGFNTYDMILKNKVVELDESCACEISLDGLTAPANREIRKATTREIGLCTDNSENYFCEPVKYYNEDKVYNDGGEGFVEEEIENIFPSNIWRTDQIMYGKYNQKDLGHAEFDLSNVCLKDSEEDRCLSDEIWYNSDKEICNKGEAGCSNSKMLTIGECRGFWKNKEGKVPLAECLFSDKNEDVAEFVLLSGTECERYSCQIVNETQNNYMTEDEKNMENSTEEIFYNARFGGLSHGFANWDTYKKGTYNPQTGLDNIQGYGYEENDYGDDLEQRTAESCIAGYAPAGFKTMLEKYFPAATELLSYKTATSEEIREGVENKNLIFIEDFIENLLGKNDIYMSESLVNLSTGYIARNHLPVRYCNQMGEWMEVDDIYNKYNMDLYYKNNDIFSDLDDNGFVKFNLYKKSLQNAIDYNTYREEVDYSKKYCERLFCSAIDEDKIIKIDLEEKNPEPNPPKYLLNSGISTNVGYYANDINKYTYWRHAGGATWEQAPAPIFKDNKTNDKTIFEGECVFDKNFLPVNSSFLQETSSYDNIRYSSFDMQYNELFKDKESFNQDDFKKKNLVTNYNTTIQPTRECSEWGIWGKIENKCVEYCEMIDPFRTNFTDENSNGLVDRNEIKGLYENPLNRRDYFINSDEGLQVGDIYTGGAKWGRALVGDVVVGECDSTISKGDMLTSSNGGLIPALEDVIFIKNGINTEIANDLREIMTAGRPYRECQKDGTWGPVQDPCVVFDGCSTRDVLNLELNSNYQVGENRLIGTLTPSSLNYTEISRSSDSDNYIVNVEASCDNTYYTGKISQSCNLNTKSWDADSLDIGCEFRTCDEKNINIGGGKIVNLDSKKYYGKGTGLRIAGNSFEGYETFESCPKNYICKNCLGSEVNFVCDSAIALGLENSDGYNYEDNPLTWQQTGTCEPVSCSFSSLENIASLENFIATQELIGGDKDFLIDVFFSGEDYEEENIGNTNNKYDMRTNSFAAGSALVLKIKEGFTTSSQSNISPYAYCNSLGKWEIVSPLLTPSKCPNSLEDRGGKWGLVQVGQCADGSQIDANRCPGAVVDLFCEQGYSVSGAGSVGAQCMLNTDNGEANWVYTSDNICVENQNNLN